MANILLNIPTEVFQNLSYSERFLLDYIQEHLAVIPTMSIVKLSEEAKVSTATIVRLMKKIGFDGYTSFKYQVKEQLATPTKSDDLKEIDKQIKQVIKKNELEVMNTISLLNIEAIEQAVQKIYQAEKVYFFSRGFSEMIAAGMNTKLQILKKNAELHTDPNIIIAISKRLKPSELVIFVSLNGETKELVEAGKNCRIQHIPTITITVAAESALAQMSDIVLRGFKSTISLLPDYEVRSRLPLEVISRILLDTYIVRTK